MHDHLTGEILSALVDNEIKLFNKEAVERHLKECLACNREFEKLSAIKIRFRAMPTRMAPSELIRKLRRTYTAPSWKERLAGWFAWRRVWKPAGAFAAVSMVTGVLLFKSHIAREDYVDMDSLLVAHSRYQAESLIPQADMAKTDFSARLASFYNDEN